MAKYRNIILRDTAEAILYKGVAKPSSKDVPLRARRPHGEWLMKQFELARTEAKSYTPSMVAAIKSKQGMYIEFTGKDGFELVTKGLEDIRAHIRLLNVRPDDNSATVFIPAGKEIKVIKKIEGYINENTKKGDPKNNALIAGIEQIKAATIEAFWIGDKNDIPRESAIWCEIWLLTESLSSIVVCEKFFTLCDKLKIEHKDEYIDFPERTIVLARVTYANLADLIGTSDSLAEFRKAPESAEIFIGMPPREESEWAIDLSNRLSIQDTNSTVCIMDTGVAFAHPLLEQSLPEEDSQAVKASWGNTDHDGHGTGMAGVALFNDLYTALVSQEPVNVTHTLESIKILPPRGETPEELYGAITGQGALLAEINHPEKNRVFCMAVTANDKSKDGRPSSWSGAVDSLTAGVGANPHRLFIVSAGNVGLTDLKSSGYPDANRLYSVESPGQAWNAVTVGAYANLVQTSLLGHQAVADVNSLSPHSSTSLSWDKKWPVKPDILCAGGNMASDGTSYTDCDDLSLLTLSHDFVHHKFETTRATSAATAQAAWMAAKIQAHYPDLWPETVRALLIHSAEWTGRMKDEFCSDDKKTSGIRQLFRMCGYGIPNLDRALYCVENSVNMVMQAELQPYKKVSSVCSMNEMHLHTIPWPSGVLRELIDIQATMRVTLSYFIEPGPGEVGWKDKYRYPSCGLRFDVNNPGETKDAFTRRVNAAMRDEDEERGSNDSSRWFLGKNRDVGSIHSDYWIGQATELCESHYIAIYPTVGWWRQRTNLGMCNERLRYALVVSITTPPTENDLYTTITTQIKIPNEIYFEV